MPLISKTITGMYGGVSQQPAALRLDNQCEEMTNCMPTLVDGVYKRPPVEYVATLKTHAQSATATRSERMHFIDRDSNEKYVVIFTGLADDPIRVFSLLDGTEKAVAYENQAAIDYATNSDTRANIKALTIGDYTVVANSTIIPKMTATAGGTWKPFAIANVLHGVAGTDYEIIINGERAAFFTTGDTAAYTTYKTSNIASELYNDIVTWQATQDTPEDWEIVYGGSSILIFNDNEDDFTFKVEDSWGNAALVGIKEQAAKLEDLPNRLPDNSGYATDVFTMTRGQEYYNGVLLAEDPDDPGVYVELGQCTGDFGHNHALHPYNEDTVYMYNMMVSVLVLKNFPASASFYGSGTAANFWYSDSWVVDIDGYVVTAYREDGLRTRLSMGYRYYRDGNWAGLVTPNPWVTQAHHEIVDFTDMAVKIYGEGTKTDFTGYYLRWKNLMADGVTNATGTWVETMKGGLYNDIDPAKAPHKLVREADGTFTFEPIVWEPRKIGDMDSAPAPSWIGTDAAPVYINDVFFHKNRLGFLAGGHVILSKSDDYWDFFPTTALEVLDDDPIDITIPSTGVDALRWAVPNKGDLLIFGPNDQYLLTSGDQVFGTKTASMDQNTNFPISAEAAPLKCGANVYFISPKGAYAAVHEYFTQPQTLTDDAADVAAHVPKYVPAAISSLTGSPTFNLVAMTTGDHQDIYLYKYYWAGDQKAQSAWFKWHVEGVYIKAISIIDNYMYLITDTGATYYLEKINLEAINDLSLNFGIHLDHKTSFAATHSYNAGTNISTWDVGHTMLSSSFMAPDAADPAWILVNAETGKQIDNLHYTSASHCHVLGDYQTTDVVIGYKYSQTFTFSEFGVPAPKGNVYSPQGRLQLRTLNVSFKETPMFELVVTPSGTVEGGRSAITHDYSGVEMGLATLGSVQLTSARKRFLIWANAIGVTIQLRNTNHFPATWYEASWEGYYTTRNQGIG